MNCRKVHSLVSAYVDSELGGMDMLAIRHHMAECEECRRDVESMLNLKRVFGSLNPPTPSDGFAVRVLMCLDELPAPTRRHLLSVLHRPILVFPRKMKLAAAGIAMLALLLVLRGGEVGMQKAEMTPQPMVSMYGPGPVGFVIPGQTAPVFVLSDAAEKPVVVPWKSVREVRDPNTFFGDPSLQLTSY